MESKHTTFWIEYTRVTCWDRLQQVSDSTCRKFHFFQHPFWSHPSTVVWGHLIYPQTYTRRAAAWTYMPKRNFDQVPPRSDDSQTSRHAHPQMPSSWSKRIHGRMVAPLLTTVGLQNVFRMSSSHSLLACRLWDSLGLPPSKYAAMIWTANQLQGI